MGWIMNLAVKTAVKKSLLEITDRMDRYPDLSYKEKVEGFVALAGLSSELPSCLHWESTFFLIVLLQTRSQLTTLSNFKDYMPIIVDLTSDWINRTLGGDAKNMYAEINPLGG